MRFLTVFQFVIAFWALPSLATANVAADLLTKPAEFVSFLATQQLSAGKAFAQSGSRSRIMSMVVPPANAVQGDVREAQNQGSFSYMNTIKQREQAAGKGCVSKNNMFLRDIPLDSIFPIVIGDLSTIQKEKEDNKSNPDAFGGDAATGDAGYFGYTRPVAGKEAWYGLWSDVGLYIGFWEPLAIAESVEQAFCFPGSQLMGNILSGLGGALDSTLNTYGAPDGGDGHGAGFLYAHWYMTPEMTLLFGALSDLGIRCATTGIANLSDSASEGFVVAKGAPFIYLSELDPTWENDALAMLTVENPYHALYHVATAVLPMLSQPMCKVDCQSANGQGLQNELTQNYAKSGLLYRHCAGCQGYLYPLSGHTKLTGRNAAHLIVQRMMTKLSHSTLLSLASRPGSQVGGRLETASGKPAMCKACAGPSGQDRIGDTYEMKEGVFKGFLKKSDYKLMMLSPQNEKDRPCVDDENTSDKGRCNDKRYFVPLGRSVDAREKDLLLRKTDASESSGSGAAGSGGASAGSLGSTSGVNPDPARMAACLESSFASRSGTPTAGGQQTAGVSEPAIPADWIQNGPPDNTQFFTENGRLVTHYVRRYGSRNEPRWILAGLDPEEKDFHRLNPPLQSGTILYAVVPGRAGTAGQPDGRSPAYVWYSGNSQPSPYLIYIGQNQQVNARSGKSVGDIVNSLNSCTGLDLKAIAGELLQAFVENFDAEAAGAAQGSAVSETADVAKIVQSWLKTIAPFIGLGNVTGGVSRVPTTSGGVARNPNEAGLAMQDQKNTTEQSMKVQILRPNFAFAVTRKRNCCDPLAPYPMDHSTGNNDDQHDLGAKTLMMSTGVITAIANNCQMFNPVALGIYDLELGIWSAAPVGNPPKFNWRYLDRFSGSALPHCFLSLTKSCSSEAKTLIRDRALFDAIINSTKKNIDFMLPDR